MTLARGFKSYCERAVAALRDELCLQDDQPIDMDGLAEHLCIPVHALGRFLKLSEGTRSDPDVEEVYRKVSAFTFFDGPRRLIVFNDEHVETRHRSNMAHELAHAVLHHPATNSGLGATQEDAHEREAAWMGGVLMLTAHQARRIAVTGMDKVEAAMRYRLSPDMLRFRLNVTGAGRLAMR